MSGILYYVPEIQPVDIRKIGLSYAIESGPTRVEVRDGPAGTPGQIICSSGCVPASQVGYYPDRQEWHKMPTRDIWVGHDGDVTPDCLMRNRQLPGHAVCLSDGNEWLVPAARIWQDADGASGWYDSLPRKSVLNQNGQWATGEIIDKYRRLWDLSGRCFEALQDQFKGITPDDASISFSEENELASVALQANYLIGPEEISILGLFDDESRSDVILATIDWPTFLRWAKKNAEADGLNSSNGKTGSHRNTHQHSPT